MHSLISINKKFMEVTPNRLVELILNTKSVKGVEAYIDIENSNELKYLGDLVFLLKKNNLILQIHANSNVNIKDQLKYMKLLEEYALELNQVIPVTFHSLYNEDKVKSLMDTIIYLSEITGKTSDNLAICLENLNDEKGYDRLEKEYIRPVILNDERLYLTYDIGHEIADFGDITNLDSYYAEEIRNVHIHTNDLQGHDHLPIYLNDVNYNLIVKGLTYLKYIKYVGNIVYEYDLYACKGNTIEEKIIDYLNSIDLISEHYN